MTLPQLGGRRRVPSELSALVRLGPGSPRVQGRQKGPTPCAPSALLGGSPTGPAGSRTVTGSQRAAAREAGFHPANQLQPPQAAAGERMRTREEPNAGPGAAEDGVVAVSRRRCEVFLVSCSRRPFPVKVPTRYVRVGSAAEWLPCREPCCLPVSCRGTEPRAASARIGHAVPPSTLPPLCCRPPSPGGRPPQPGSSEASFSVSASAVGSEHPPGIPPEPRGGGRGAGI